ncbi:G-type lectin S-receptor-like serine/threonine-protein kinase SD2-5 [Solanum dulcamara]|uniref:G-type lectin S-receptor-like serine/threonine-protein kinase SD2-5 n=1 Tax=Solanum dulcamara TaxID=45834 RepID=UPI0024853291|nr:G-type lectin S-receptor-like serine/threonine-protein kinase SD2-5 [Solanum dulcamara]
MDLPSVKHLLKLLIIVLLENLTLAQFPVYHTVKTPTTWINNNVSSINVTKPFIYPFYSFNQSSGPFMRILMLKEIEKDMGYACGFASNGEDDSFVFSIGIVRLHRDYEGTQRWTDLELLWFANRNHPVRENGTLQLLQDGDLVLKDVDGTLVWSTGTANKFVSGIKMMDTGNLVLHDMYNQTVWQSFDHPTDALLPGQKLRAGQRLVARVSSSNWTEGKYYISVTNQGLFAFYISDKPQMYFKFLVSGDRDSFDESYVKAVNGTLALYISSTEPNEPNAVFSRPSRMKFLRYDYDGHLQAYTEGNDHPNDLLADFIGFCDYPTACGSLELCANGFCSCPGAFIKSNDRQNNGCVEVSPVECDGQHSHRMERVSDVYYFNYVDTDAAALRGTDEERCQEMCLKNCSCKVVLFRYFTNFSSGDCYLPSPVLSLINDGKERSVYESSAFIKLPNNEEKSKSTAARRHGIIAGSTGAIFILIALTVGILIAFNRKQTLQENNDDYSGEISGLVRFSYEQLKMATGNFQKKLGQGGFGSVYEGVLQDGQKVAVKVLDGFGQGKKEFLAEIQTIGSIHHVNLVRLIGVCAEKEHTLLVYDFMSNGSLDIWIFGTTSTQFTLDWQIRRKIIHDIAKGLAYLHEECMQRIVHLDVKPQNILLDDNFCAKVSDFGLAKLVDKDQSHIVTRIRGTPGYLAPEWCGAFITEKADVYSFGVVAMEILCGRKNVDYSHSQEHPHLLSLFMTKAKNNQLIDVIGNYSDDPQCNTSEVIRMMKLAVWCLQSDFTLRPSMSMVVKVIEGTMDIESYLDYSVPNSQTIAAIKRVAATTTTLFPSILSGPR